MDQKQFQTEYHWMCGLEEYYNYNGEGERYQLIHKALYHDNWYRKRDIMVELYDMQYSDHIKPWMNLIMHEHLTDIEIKPQLVVTLLRKHMYEHPFLVSLAKFINYWSGENGEAADMPDINDFLSRGQVKSKLWMIEELKKVIDGSIGNVVFYGGWYNFLAHILYEQFELGHVYSLDLDENVVAPSKRLYPDEVLAGTFLPLTVDVNKIVWEDNKINFNNLKDDEKFKLEHPGKFQHTVETNLIINTSCEHMDNTWFENIPSGRVVVLQTNDYFANPQHSNCCKDLAEAKAKYPMRSIMYEGELDTHLYNRFMLIGVK